MAKTFQRFGDGYLYEMTEADPTVMTVVREELGLGCVAQLPGRPKGIEAKFNIAKVLDIEINSVNKFKQKTGSAVCFE